MDLQKELIQMNREYDGKRMGNLFLMQPSWLYSRNAMSAVFREKKKLLREGTVCYAHIVQANTILFRTLPPADCPASILYSTDPVEADLLAALSWKIFSYKNQKQEQIPEQWQELARIVTNEYDYSHIRFQLENECQLLHFHFQPIMVFRKLLPGRKLSGSLLPVLTHPECEAVLILPHKYWTEEFKQKWLRGEL